MSRILDVVRKWLGLSVGLAQGPEPEPAEGGVLFGLDPPPGCHFKVHCHRNEAWFVSIVRGREELSQALELIEERYSRGKSDEDLIVLAAKNALQIYERKQAVAVLEGCYPPKRTQAGA